MILFKSLELKEDGIFATDSWPGGLYGTVSITGSRPSSSMVGAWIATMRLGRSGLRDSVRRISNCLKHVVAGINSIPELKVIGNPQVKIYILIQS